MEEVLFKVEPTHEMPVILGWFSEFPGNNANETEQARIDFEKRMMEKAAAAQKVLSQLSTWMWKCDTPTYDQIENETYIRFNELLQVRPFFVLAIRA